MDGQCFAGARSHGQFRRVVRPEVESVLSCVTIGTGGEAVTAWAKDGGGLVVGDKNLWACRGDLNPPMTFSRRRVWRCDASAALLIPLWRRCSTPDASFALAAA